MSYINKIEDDYNKGLISLDEISQQRQKYQKASKEEKEAMDKPYQTEVKATSNPKSPLSVEDDIQTQLKSIKNTVESNHTILMVFVVISIISVVFGLISIAAIS